MNEAQNTIEAGLYLRGEELVPDEITSALGLQPTYAQRKGDQHTTKTGQLVTKKIGVWSIEASDLIDISAWIKELVERAMARCGRLNELPGVEEAYVDVFLAEDAKESGAGIEIRLLPATLSAASSAGLELRVALHIVAP